MARPNQQAVEALRAALGPENVLTDAASLSVYAYDATAFFHGDPALVVLPHDREPVLAAVRICAEHGLAIVPRGSGTNLSAGTAAPTGSVILSLNRLRRIVEIDQDNLTATVEPGVRTAELDEAVRPLGLFYPPDPGSKAIATLGGNVAENSGGLRGLKYGVTRDYVMGLEVVLADGSLLRLGGKNVKDVAGYDLLRLFVGSEGTLGIFTEITVRLLPTPETAGTMLASFTDLEAAARTVSRIIAARIIPVTLEFLDQGTIEAIEAFQPSGLPRDAGAVLLLQQDGSPEAVHRDLAAMAALARAEGATSLRVAESAAEAERLMQGRRVALSALARRKPHMILEDATVPRSQLAPMVRAVSEIAQRHRVDICTFGHVGDGNLHPTCLLDGRDPDELRRAHAAFDEIFDRALALGGTITGEHGVGLAKAAYLRKRAGDRAYALMQEVKRVFDPENRLNPGKLFGGHAHESNFVP